MESLNAIKPVPTLGGILRQIGGETNTPQVVAKIVININLRGFGNPALP
jgi:hypothetical protein